MNNLTSSLLKDLTFYKKDNLVYTYVLKNASTYYSNLLKYNNWDRILYRDINFNKHHVFGFIMDPINRYFKGLAEDITNNINNTEEFFTNNNSNEFIFLSGHCVPISLTYIDFYKNIDWIPLDIGIESDQFFKKLLEHHGIDFNFDNVFDYKSTSEKINLYKKLKDMFINNDILHKVLHKDILLYNSVIENFNPNGSDWNSISWLKKI